MATVGEPQRKILVIDAGGIIEAKENNLHRLASEFYTTSSVVQELKDTRSRAFFDTFPLPIHIKEPSPNGRFLAKTYATLTGDYYYLSRTDLDIIAVAIDLEIQKGEGNLTSIEELKQKLKIFEGKTILQKVSLEPFDEIMKKYNINAQSKEKFSEEDGEEKEGEELNAEEIEKQQEEAEKKEEETEKKEEETEKKEEQNPEDDGEGEWQTVTSKKKKRSDKEENYPKSFNNWITKENIKEFDSHINGSEFDEWGQTEEEAKASVSQFTGNGQNEEVEFQEVEIEENEDENDEDDEDEVLEIECNSDDDEQTIQEKVKKLLEERKKAKQDSKNEENQPKMPKIMSETADSIEEKVKTAVGVITTDFSVQNVLLHMKINIVTVDGKRMKFMKQWVKVCSACHTLVPDMKRIFCPSCGNDTLRRISCIMDENGETHYVYNPKKTFSLRGTIYTIPKSKGGKRNLDPVLREDQLISFKNGKPKKSAVFKSKKSVASNERMTQFFGEDDSVGNPFSGVETKSRKQKIVAGGNYSERFHGFNEIWNGYGRKNPNEPKRKK